MFAAVVLASLWLQVLDRVHWDRASGEITLAGRNAALRETPAPSRWDVVTDLVEHRGKMLAAVCMDFDETSFYPPLAYSHGARILVFEPAVGEWSLLREHEESMFFNLRVVGDRLLVPEYFPMNDRSRRIHTFDGEKWGELGLLPRQAWHVMDVRGIGDRLYASGSWRDEDEEARGSDPDWWAGYGRVFESGDGGETWRSIRRSRERGRILDLVEFRGRLWANEAGRHLIAWNGSAWEEVPVRLPGVGTAAKLGNARLIVFGGRILAYHAELLYSFDGRAWSSRQPGALDLWAEPGRLYGLRADGHVWTSEDGTSWSRLTREGISAAEFDRKTPKGRPLHRGSIALHRGRLVAGTAATGKIFAAPCEDRGTWTSDAVDLAGPGPFHLHWEADGSGVRVRFRSAGSRADLTRAPWSDLAESPARVPIGPGHRWGQYRVELHSDGLRTPVVRALRWRAK